VTKPVWWLESRLHFSFADYYDPSRMGFGALRVFNDDLVKPRAGFGWVAGEAAKRVPLSTARTGPGPGPGPPPAAHARSEHPHRDAEIFSYVVDGKLSHR
jgi:redox-sensitive bicupin YhaK (pirin superfamily)